MIIDKGYKLFLFEVKDKGPMIKNHWEDSLGWFADELREYPSGVINIHPVKSDSFVEVYFEEAKTNLEAINSFFEQHQIALGKAKEKKNTWKSVLLTGLGSVFLFVMFFFLARLLSSWILLPFKPLAAAETISMIFWSIQLTMLVASLVWFARYRQSYNIVFSLLAFGITLVLAHRGF